VTASSLPVILCQVGRAPHAGGEPPASERENDMWLALLVLGLIVVVFSLGRLLGRKRKGALGQPPSPTPAPRGPGVERASEQVQELLGDLESLAKEMNARLDTKISLLETLIRQADERIAKLESGSGHAEGSGGDIIAEPAAPAPDEPEGAGRDAGGEDDRDERFGEIYELADRGLSAAEISQRTGVLTGEVELILGLRGKRPPEG